MKKTTIILAIFVFTVAVSQDYELIAVKDARVWSVEPDSSYGTEDWLAIQGGSGSEDLARSLIQFDLEELPYTEDIVAEALLGLWVLPDTDYITGGHAGVYMAAGPWEEAAVTWNSAPPEDKSATVIQVLPPHPSLWFEVDITDIVHSWLYFDAENHGLYVEILEETPYAFPRFAAREYVDEEYRPRLQITYATGMLEEIKVRTFELYVPSVATREVDISFSLPSATRVSCGVYDVTGKLVEVLLSGQVSSGDHKLIWDSSQVQKGIYFVRFRTTEASFSRKMVLVK